MTADEHDPPADGGPLGPDEDVRTHLEKALEDAEATETRYHLREALQLLGSE